MVPFNLLVATRYGHMIVHAHDMYAASYTQEYIGDGGYRGNALFSRKAP